MITFEYSDFTGPVTLEGVELNETDVGALASLSAFYNWIVRPVGAVAAGYHGYKRSNGSALSTVGWGACGYFFPIITNAVAAIMKPGFGKRMSYAHYGDLKDGEEFLLPDHILETDDIVKVGKLKAKALVYSDKIVLKPFARSLKPIVTDEACITWQHGNWVLDKEYCPIKK